MKRPKTAAVTPSNAVQEEFRTDESFPIIVNGARTHNLKGINCRIPAGSLTVITGVSGSGKSSLAFDTLFAEGQRRYVESLSTYARQFIARMPRPDVDLVENIPPAIALEQKNSVRNARSTVGTATEINDYLRLLFARAGENICPTTQMVVRRDSPDSAVTMLLEKWPEARVYMVAPYRLKEKKYLKETLAEFQRQGFNRLYLEGEVVELDDPAVKLPKVMDVVPVLVDRLAVRTEERNRLAEAVENAFRISRGSCRVINRDGSILTFTEELRCAGCPGECGHIFREPTPQLLNFSSPLGACPTCQGFGRVTGLDWGKIIPNPALSLNEGAIAPWSGETARESLEDLRKASKALGVRMNIPWYEMEEREQEIVMQGSGKWYGIKGFFDYLEERRYKIQARVMIARYRGYSECPDCVGSRLRGEALSIRIGGRNIGELCAMSVKDVVKWFDTLKLSGEQAAIAERPLAEVRARLSYLMEVGLGYLSLSRQTRTLSGGESQRINLSTSLGSALTDTLYVLDEPTVGLHARDTDRLVGILKRLQGLGNTLVVVEHDPDVMRESDWLIDIGPAAGEKGGRVIFEGVPSDIGKVENSKTAQYLAEFQEVREKVKASGGKPKRGGLQKFGRREPLAYIRINGASENNLKHVQAKIPIGVLCCVTGVSGSGKSTLIKSCLYNYYQRYTKMDASAEAGKLLSIQGLNLVDDIVLVDQEPIGRSSRSNAATYLKAYDAIRDLLSGTSEAKTLGFTSRDFSFNVTGGRCETCEGTGYRVIDMHFLADVSVVCETCEGRRFQEHILDIQWNDKHISDILAMTVDDACDFFEGHSKILAGLDPLRQVGLGYLRLGQSTATLSGGEAQRLKLAAHLSNASDQRNLLLLFDEPSTGLHPADLDVLLKVFDRLVERGFSLVVIEHNMQVIRHADWIIDLGPEGGEDGGHILCEGTPEEVATHPDSITGRYLRRAGGAKPLDGSKK